MATSTSKKMVYTKSEHVKGRAKHQINKAGESTILSKHFDQLRGINEDNQPYQNIPWDVNKHFEAVDLYEIAVMALFVLPQVVYVYPLLFILLLPPAGLNLLYISWFVPERCDMIPRNTKFRCLCIVQAVLCFPALVVASLSLAVSRFAMLVFGIVYCMWEEGAWQRYQHNLKIIEPYCHGPLVLSYFSDCVAGVASMVHRRGLLEFTSSFSLMFIINPWIKYWITGNIYLTNLGERFVTQIGSAESMNMDQMCRRVRNYISRAKSPDATRRYISSAFFCPHFQYPPPTENRFFAVGLEHSTIAAFVHATHFQAAPDCIERSISLSYPTCISPTAEVPIYRVVLWFNNPYHIYTGVVEANISKGKQPEHPMWLISSHNRLAADPRIMLSTGWIDTFLKVFFLTYPITFVRLLHQI
eukprot:CCRYP_020600-RA/>CCRYP_020600-RA protein AED:0.36 eAED:0.35 QI:126/1/0.33/1/0/0/3/0/414